LVLTIYSTKGPMQHRGILDSHVEAGTSEWMDMLYVQFLEKYSL
jgi:hypothetical protein